jgi:hypothetical protein
LSPTRAAKPAISAMVSLKRLMREPFFIDVCGKAQKGKKK